MRYATLALLLLLCLPGTGQQLCSSMTAPDRATGMAMQLYSPGVTGGGTPIPFDLYCAEADSLFARVSSWGALSANEILARKANIDTLIRALKADTIWQRLDIMYIFAAPSSQMALLNWTKRGHNGTIIPGAGTMTFIADSCFKGDGVASYLEFDFIAATDAVQMTSSAGAFGIGSTAFNTNGNYKPYVSAGDSLMLLRSSPSETIVGYCNSTNRIKIYHEPTPVDIAIVKDSPTNLKILSNNVVIESGPVTNKALATQKLLAFKQVNLLQYSNNTLTFLWLGAALPDAKISQLSHLLHAYLSKL